VKLRGRFTLALSLAALVPIALAAVETREVIASSARDDQHVLLETAHAELQHEVERLKDDMRNATQTLASPNHTFVGFLAREVAKTAKTNEHLDAMQAQQFYEQGRLEQRGLSLDELTIVGPDSGAVPNAVLVGHARGTEKPEVRRLANICQGHTAYFTYRSAWDDRGGKSPTLLVEGAALSVDSDWPAFALALTASRKVGDGLLQTIRSKPIDAQLVRSNGDVIVGPSDPDQWPSDEHDPEPVRLDGPNGEEVARVEIAVVDSTGAALRRVTLWSVVLALVALGGVVLIGLAVARRTARDLDQLVAGSLAAARGDLDHRVPVRSHDEVGAVASAFNFMMEDLKTSKERLVIAERIAAWQEIARRLAHEIKNPLTPIQMAMDTLRKSWKKQHPSFDEILEESTTTVLQEADRLKHIVAEFSDFARMPKPEFGRVDLNELVRSALTLYQGAVALDIKLAESLPTCDADKNQINQVLLNLVENARDAISQRIDPATGRIAVSTRLGEAADRVMLVVEDNGPGVPADLKDKVFAPYFTTKHAKGGTGLGLAIVHRIVSDHGGRITISDARGGGARFTIEIPLRNGTALLASRI
jgi:two-component system nitrogen regulation sensor histidine kinase NtrY